MENPLMNVINQSVQFEIIRKQKSKKNSVKFCWHLEKRFQGLYVTKTNQCSLKIANLNVNCLLSVSHEI